MFGLGKLVGKVAGELIAAPATIAAEAVEAVEETIETAANALERAGDKIAGEEPKR